MTQQTTVRYLFNLAALSFNMALVVLQCITPKRSRRRKAANRQPLIPKEEIDTSDAEPTNTVKFSAQNNAGSSNQKHELTAAQIDIIKKAAPISIQVKFSDMKFREGKRTFSFSTKLAKIPKLFGEKRSSDASDSYFEFTGADTPSEAASENQWDSRWFSNGQPATIVY